MASELPTCTPNCFSADTLVSTPAGLFTVTATIAHRDPSTLWLTLGGERIETTPEHPFFTLERGWVGADDLWRGAHVRRADGSFDVSGPSQLKSSLR